MSIEYYYKAIICITCVIILVCIMTYYTQLENFRSSLRLNQTVRYKVPASKNFKLGKIIKIQEDGVTLFDRKTLQTYFIYYKFIYPAKKSDNTIS